MKMDATNERFLLHPMMRQMHAVHLRRSAVLHTFSLVMLLLTPKQALALDPWQPTAQELNSLPPFCRTKFENQGSAADKAWTQTLGGAYMHVHHYCAGLNFLNRYYRNPDNAQYKLGKVVGEMGYMIDKTPAGSKLLPNIYLTSGKALMLLKRSQEGMTYIHKALELDPKSLPAYLAVIEYYRGLNFRNKALDYATDGLRYLPNSKALQRIYGEMGGAQPYPESYEKKEAPNPQANKNSAQAEAELPAATQVPAGDSPPPNNNQSVKEPVPNNPSSSTTIGSPTNPWCRFCTD
jgi:tetratricopeptide (TPR) repeat protein